MCMHIVVAVQSQDGMRLVCANAILAVHSYLQNCTVYHDILANLASKIRIAKNGIAN